MKKVVVLTLIIMIAVLAIYPTVSLAWDPKAEITEIEAATPSGSVKTSAQKIVNGVLQVIKVVAAGVAIIMLIFLAMKYMMASAGDKAEIKKHAVVYVVGALVLFATSGILSIIQAFSSNIA